MRSVRDLAYEASDWTLVPGVVANPGSRLYVCRERYRAEESSEDLNRPEIDPIRGFVSRWRCAGHPSLRVPAVVDGVEVSPKTDFGRLAAEELASPDERLPDGLWLEEVRSPAFWLIRLYRLLEASTAPRLAADLSRAVADRLTDESPLVRPWCRRVLHGARRRARRGNPRARRRRRAPISSRAGSRRRASHGTSNCSFFAALIDGSAQAIRSTARRWKRCEPTSCDPGKPTGCCWRGSGPWTAHG